MANATAAPVASNVRAANPARASARGITNNARRATKTNAGVRSAQFFQGDVDASMELRQRNIASAVSHRASAKRVVTASATPAPIVQAGDAAVAPKAEWKGAKLKPLGYSVLAGLIIWCIPAPVGVTVKAWHLFAVFVGTIVGIITNVRTSHNKWYRLASSPRSIDRVHTRDPSQVHTRDPSQIHEFFQKPTTNRGSY